MTLLLESDQVAFEVQPGTVQPGTVQPGTVQPDDEWWEPAGDSLSCTSDPFDDFDEDDFDDDFDDDFEEDWDEDLPTDEG
jgi:hypothetical protein